MDEFDEAYKEAEKVLKRMERQVHSTYRRAYSQAQAKADEYLKNFIKADAEKRKQVANGTITNAEYQRWRTSHIMQGERWVELADTLATDMTNHKLIASSIINGHLPEVYAIGYNYGLYQVEKQTLFETSFTLYDRHTVERLLRDKPDLLPKATVNIPKDVRWNKSQLNSAVTQGILQGESIPEISQRIANVTGTNEASAIRTARTMTTSAENGGRIESYRYAESLGIKMSKTWIATLDSRTRHSHRLVDRETVEDINDEFSNGCKFPGDPDGHPSEIYNCRCTMISQVVAIDLDVSFPKNGKLGDMSYEEWKYAKVR